METVFGICFGSVFARLSYEIGKLCQFFEDLQKAGYQCNGRRRAAGDMAVNRDYSGNPVCYRITSPVNAAVHRAVAACNDKSRFRGCNICFFQGKLHLSRDRAGDKEQVRMSR